MSDKIIFYQYFATKDLEYFRKLVMKYFRKSGHTREIEFRVWVCDDDIPPKDGDIYCYDAFVKNFLVHNGYIRQLPEIIDTSDVFPWVMETSKVKGKTYGFPWMLCFDAIICRREDYRENYTDADLQNNIVIPLGTYYPLYYFYAKAISQNGCESSAIETLKKMALLTGNPKKAIDSHYQDSDVLDDFISKRKKYICHFSEIVSSFPDDDYAASPLKFSQNRSDDFNLFYADFVSLGNNVEKEKLLDCLDLVEIITSKDFILELCAPNGQPTYMCPSLASAYEKLAEYGKFYYELFRIVSGNNNYVIHFDKDYYQSLNKACIDVKQELDSWTKNSN